MLPDPCYIISDAHLGAAPAETERQVLRFLRSLEGRAKSLVVNGDLFDFWFEWKTVVPRRAVRAVAALAELKAEYDYVLIDSPPVLAVTDPCVIAGQVDGVLLAIRISKNGRPGAERAKEMLANLGVNILGVVVNATRKEGTPYGYRYYQYEDYRYQYRNGYGDPQPAQGNGQPVVG